MFWVARDDGGQYALFSVQPKRKDRKGNWRSGKTRALNIRPSQAPVKLQPGKGPTRVRLTKTTATKGVLWAARDDDGVYALFVVRPRKGRLGNWASKYQALDTQRLGVSVKLAPGKGPVKVKLAKV